MLVVMLAGVTGVPSTVAHADPAGPTADGEFSGTGSIGPSSTFDLVVTGRGGVPASGVTAVALNVSVTNASAPSYLTVYPTGSGRPTAANLVFTANQTVSNMVIAKVGNGGQVTIYNYTGAVDVVIDVVGWFAVGSAFTAYNPARLMDTRPGYPTIDGAAAGAGKVGPGATSTLPVSGRAGVPSSGVGSVVLNVSVTNPTAGSYLTVFPTGAPRPTAANLTFNAGQSVQNMVIAKVGDDGQVSMFNYAGSADVIVDLLGWFPSSSGFNGINPSRLMDTRTGYPTIDGAFTGGGAVAAGAVGNVTVLNRGGLPAGNVDAVAMNVTVTGPSAASYLTAFPGGASRPLAANVTFNAGQTVSNMVIVRPGTNGNQMSLFNFAGATDVVVDALGWFPAGSGFTALTPTRIMDSRVTRGTAQKLGPGRYSVQVSHPTWGDVRLITQETDDRGYAGNPGPASLKVVDTTGTTRYSYQADDPYEFIPAGVTACGLSDDVTTPVDRLGHIFIVYNPGRYEGTIVLAPSPSGLNDFGSLNPTLALGRFYSACPVDLNRDGIYEIESSINDCIPDCGRGTTHVTVHWWNGTNYV